MAGLAMLARSSQQELQSTLDTRLASVTHTFEQALASVALSQQSQLATQATLLQQQQQLLQTQSAQLVRLEAQQTMLLQQLERLASKEQQSSSSKGAVTTNSSSPVPVLEASPTMEETIEIALLDVETTNNTSQEQGQPSDLTGRHRVQATIQSKNNNNDKTVKSATDATPSHVEIEVVQSSVEGQNDQVIASPRQNDTLVDQSSTSNVQTTITTKKPNPQTEEEPMSPGKIEIELLEFSDADDFHLDDDDDGQLAPPSGTMMEDIQEAIATNKSPLSSHDDNLHLTSGRDEARNDKGTSPDDRDEVLSAGKVEVELLFGNDSDTFEVIEENHNDIDERNPPDAAGAGAAAAAMSNMHGM